MYQSSSALAVTGGVGTWTLATSLELAWVAVAGVTLIFAGLALLRLIPRRES